MSQQIPDFPKLNNDNYPEWVDNMKNWLQSLGLWRIVSGTKTTPILADPAAPTPAEAADLERFLGDVERAAGFIKRKVEAGQKKFYKSVEDDPIQIWSKLEAAHLTKLPTERFNAYSDFFAITLGPDESLSSVLLRIDQAFQRILNLRPKVFTLTDLDDELQSMAMIRALTPEYSSFRSAIMLRPDISKESLALSFRVEETNRNRDVAIAAAASSVISPSAHAARSSSTAVSSSTAASSSTASSSFTGTPSGKPSSRSKQSRPAKHCGYCNKDGHDDDHCFKRASDIIAKANSAQAAPAPAMESAGNASLPPTIPGGALSPSQIDAYAHWNVDSGATAHMTPHRHWLHNYTPNRIPIRLADARIVYSAGVGSIRFNPVIKGRKGETVEFSRVLHVPDLGNNLFSVFYLLKCCDYKLTADSGLVIFNHSNRTRFTASINQHYVAYLDGTTEPISESANLVSTLPLDLSLWHRRLGHINYQAIKRMKRDDLVTGMKINADFKPDPICEPCLAGKMHADPFPSTGNRSIKPLELVHTDLHGPVPIQTNSGFKYWNTWIDDCTDFWTIYLLKAKSSTFEAFKEYKAYAETLLDAKIKSTQDDKGGEYMSQTFIQFCTDHGIQRRHTTRNRPMQNGHGERANRTIAEGATTMLHESGLPPSFWGEAVGAFVYVRNRTATSTVTGATPYELWTGKKPDLSRIRIWGCTAYVHVQKDKRSAMGSHMEKCAFIGYPAGYKGWKFYNPVTKKVIISERAEFDERYFLCSKGPRGPPTFTLVLPDNIEPAIVQIPDLGGDDDPSGNDLGSDLPPAPAASLNAPIPEPPHTPVPESRSPSPPARSPTPPLALRRGTRVRNPPADWWRVGTSVPADSSSEDELNVLDDDGMEEVEFVAESAGLAAGAEPTHYRQAMNCPDADKWRKACEEEYFMHMENRTWELVKLPPGKKAVGSGWVFKVKRHSDGSVERHKGRLVAKGCSQRPGQDYTEVFAPCAKAATIRLILALAAVEDLHLRSVDISHAFINGELEEEIYMKQPEGFEELGPEYVCRLIRSLYGIKQAARVWNKKLHSVLASLGFKRLESDRSVYLYQKDNIRMIVPVHVDDITIASKSQSALDDFVKTLASHFKLRDLGPTELLLGIHITRDRPNRSIALSQRQYIVDMLDRYGLTDCNPVTTPMDPGLRLDASMGASTPQDIAFMRTVPYLNAVGTLLYLGLSTRPDIANATSILARFSSNPGPTHWKAVKYLMRYVKGTMDLKLVYRPDSSGQLFTSFSDADHGGSKDTGKSTGGFLIKVGTGAISWRSKLQPLVALSTTEAEYIAAVEAGKEIFWLRNLLSELGYKFTGPSLLSMDNQSAISVAKNPEHHGRMKHLDLRWYWLRDAVEDGIISPTFIPTAEMVADLLTKPLPRIKVEYCRGLMGLEK